MSSEDFLRFSTNTQIATALALIVGFLFYIAYKLTFDKKGRIIKSK